MPRLIDADRLLRPDMLRMCYHLPNGDTAMPIGDIEHAPTVDAAPVKHGKWFDAMVGELPVQVCDQCNTFFPLAYTGGGHHYCPNCGAKMDMEEKQNGTDKT